MFGLIRVGRKLPALFSLNHNTMNKRYNHEQENVFNACGIAQIDLDEINLEKENDLYRPELKRHLLLILMSLIKAKLNIPNIQNLVEFVAITDSMKHNYTVKEQISSSDSLMIIEDTSKELEDMSIVGLCLLHNFMHVMHPIMLPFKKISQCVQFMDMNLESEEIVFLIKIFLQNDIDTITDRVFEGIISTTHISDIWEDEPVNRVILQATRKDYTKKSILEAFCIGKQFIDLIPDRIEKDKFIEMLGDENRFTKTETAYVVAKIIKNVLVSPKSMSEFLASIYTVSYRGFNTMEYDHMLHFQNFHVIMEYLITKEYEEIKNIALSYIDVEYEH